MTQLQCLRVVAMSRQAGTMDQICTLRVKLILWNLLLIICANIVCLRGNPTAGDYDLHCVTDYLFTINCTMSITPSDNASDGNSIYWLKFTKIFEKTTFVCTLQNTSGYNFCSVETSGPMPDDDDDDEDDDYLDIFSDLDTFEISLCHNQNNGSEICEVLDGKYTPFTNIKPNAPCCLTVTHNSSQHHFAWKSTYEEYKPYTYLVDNFKYQLHYFKRGDRRNGEKSGISHGINTETYTNYSVDDQKFEPDTEYTARVRSSPNLMFYRGQWSDWSSEVHWKTGSEVNDVPELSKMLFITICLMVPLVLILCFAPIKKWRQTPIIPTPAPYFHTLYSDCQGDFKSWVTTQENTIDMLQEEASLQIDTIAKCTESVEENSHSQFHQQLMKGAYRNITEPVCDASLPGVPYAVSTMDSLSYQGSLQTSLALSSEHGGHAEGDSGCWLCSATSLEKGSPWYCNDYCKLSALEQTD